jgi:hypothetical protein
VVIGGGGGEGELRPPKYVNKPPKFETLFDVIVFSENQTLFPNLQITIYNSINDTNY